MVDQNDEPRAEGSASEGEADARAQEQEKEAFERRDAFAELESRIDAALSELRPKVRRAFDEMEGRMDSAMKQAQPKVDRLLEDMQPRMDALLDGLQRKIEALRKDIEVRARRSTARREPAQPSGVLAPPPEDAGESDEAAPED